jgi:hypothetical protein
MNTVMAKETSARHAAVIASEAKQSMAAREAGLLRRSAPRNDEHLSQTQNNRLIGVNASVIIEL